MGLDMRSMTRTVLFVCPHGAGKSRMAAAYLNRVAPDGWSATSAGLEPDPVVSQNAVRLLAGGDADAFLDLDVPRAVDAVSAVDRVIAIDCDVAGAERWDLASGTFDEAMREEIRGRVERLADKLSGS